MSNVSGRGWPTKRLPDQVGAPSNAATGGVPDLPKPRNSASATQAMDILADAVWRIDARDHQSSGAPLKLVRNLGTGGSVLDCRTGSTSVPDTNDPLFLPAEQSAYVYVPGVAANRLTVPDENALDIIGDLDLRAYIAADDWTPAAQSAVIGKYGASGQRSYLMTIETNGRIGIIWTTDGSTAISKTSTVAPTVSDGAPLWIRATLDVDNGATQNEVKFYTSPDGSTWTQLGTTVTTAGTTSIFSGTSSVEVGTFNGGNSGALAGRIYRAQILNGINGTTVLDVDTSVLTTGSATSFTAATGQTVTINRSTSGRKTVCVVSSPVWLFGTDDYMEVPLSATGSKALDFGPNDSFTVLFLFRHFGTTFPATMTGIGKGVSPSPRWNITPQNGANTLSGNYADANALLTTQVNGGVANGGLTVSAQIINRFSGTNTILANSLSTSSTALRTYGSGINESPLNIGRLANAVNYFGGEVIGCAIWRRALTAAEISTLTNYYQSKVA